MDETDLAETRYWFYQEYGDWAAHHTNTGHKLGFSKEGTGDDFALEPGAPVPHGAWSRVESGPAQ